MMSGEDEEVPTTAADGTVTEKWTTVALVMTVESKGMEGGDDLERIHVMEDTEVECLRREFRGSEIVIHIFSGVAGP
ncbi:UNVERIFIED_CONTAM: hypothetical protein K2H54_018400 [Gekko kuhli]